jgi:hypothetical protein
LEAQRIAVPGDLDAGREMPASDRMVQLYRDKVIPKIDAEIDRVGQSDPVRFSNLLQRISAPAVEAEARIVDLTLVG